MKTFLRTLPSNAARIIILILCKSMIVMILTTGLLTANSMEPGPQNCPRLRRGKARALEIPRSKTAEKTTS